MRNGTRYDLEPEEVNETEGRLKGARLIAAGTSGVDMSWVRFHRAGQNSDKKLVRPAVQLYATAETPSSTLATAVFEHMSFTSCVGAGIETLGGWGLEANYSVFHRTKGPAINTSLQAASVRLWRNLA
eukprot:CAMPEP_0115064828 /NCGR_PEP_ID=MMETSP0227-20121206/9911_1 /TAXON_ID=89957 /ORGANISM="Polarella glacialis, Strain CCMP 1383" /LENGTH=127 /DNA_ID=CAMNT_0002450547 /DNA_START=47 /DNA_END=426 /DNA_ORIENTATION=+